MNDRAGKGSIQLNLLADDLVADPVREAQVRRSCWKRGLNVQLADGMFWQAPRIDLPSLITSPLLPRELARSFSLGEKLQSQKEGGDSHAIALMIYHSQMASVAVHLLRQNYELSDDHWKRLLTFDTLDDMFRMTLLISEEFARSVSVWMPYLFYSNADGIDQIHLHLD